MGFLIPVVLIACWGGLLGPAYHWISGSDKPDLIAAYWKAFVFAGGYGSCLVAGTN